MAWDTTPVPLDKSLYGDGNWIPVKDDEELPQYVKDALARSYYAPGLGLSDDAIQNAKVHKFNINGQTNYGIQIPNEATYSDTGGASSESGGGNTGSWQQPAFTHFGIQVPMAPGVNVVDDLEPTFYGQSTLGSYDKGGHPAYTFGAEGAYPTPAAYAQSRKDAEDRHRATQVSPLAYAAPLFPLAVGLGAGALGPLFAGEGALGAGAAGAAEAGAGTFGLGGLGGTVGETATLLPAAATSVGAAEGAIGGGLGLGTAAPAASGAVGGGLGLGATAAGAAAPASEGIMGALSSAYTTIQNTVGSGLAAAGLTGPQVAAVAPIVTKGLIGAGGGALVSGLTTGKPLAGAITGGIGGAALGAFGGASGPLATSLGIGGGAANALIGGTVGALGSAATKGDPLMGGLTGGALGYLGSYLPEGVPSPTSLDPSWFNANGSLNEMGQAALGSASGGISPAAATAAGGAGAGSGLFGSKIAGPALALGALAAGAGALGNNGQKTTTPTGSGSTPGPESVAQTLGPYFNQGLNKDVLGRATANPWAAGVPSYWSYGGPEQSYFTNNSLKSFGFADGGGVLSYPTDDGREFSTEYGDSHVRGPGDGTSDSIEARLSDGEYVLTESELSRIGNGNNDYGAEKLDRLRKSGALVRMLANVP